MDAKKDVNYCLVAVIILLVIAAIAFISFNSPTATKEEQPTKSEPSEPVAVKDVTPPVKHKTVLSIYYFEEPFPAGANVEGEHIVLCNGDNGAKYGIYDNSIITNSPYAGYVYSGTIWPESYDSKYRKVDPTVDKPDGYYHEPIKSTAANPTISFEAGATVYGYELSFENNKKCNWAYITNSPLSGTVTNGIIWPSYRDLYFARERTGIVLVNPLDDKIWPLRYRRIDTYLLPLEKVPFKQGDTVKGDIVFDNKVSYDNALMVNSPISGKVSNGIINPSQSELKIIIDNISAFDNGKPEKLLTASDVYAN
jgi:hypothetical protein